MKDTTITNKSRIAYIDIAKGLLIILLVLGHTVNTLRKGVPSEDLFLNNFHHARIYIWTSFYMAAFFIITGYCSNFKKPFVPFLISNFKSLKIPAFVFGFTALVLRSFFNPEKNAVDNYLVAFFNSFVDSGLWFLDALFISKLLYWTILKVSNEIRVIGSVCLGAFVVGFIFYLSDYFPQYNIGYFTHALLLTLFLFLGQQMKRIGITKKIGVISGLIYMLGILLVLFSSMPVPYVTLKIRLSWITVIPWLILAYSGSLLVLLVSKYIQGNRLLEFIGKNSLVFYCSHLMVLGFLKSFFIPYFGHNDLNSLMFYLMFVLVVLGGCSIISLLVNTRYLRFLIGKF